MSERDPPNALERASRAKPGGSPSGGLDGGAVSIGLLCALGAFVPAAMFGLPGWSAAALAGAGLFVGGFLAAHVTRPGGCAVCHAGVVGITYYTVVAAFAATTYLAPGSSLAATALRTLVGNGRLVVAIALGGLVLTAIGGVLGAGRAVEWLRDR